MTDAIALGVDIGGTKARAALVTAEGSLHLCCETPTAAAGGADPGLTRSLALAIDVVTQSRDQGWQVDAIGVGMPEYVDAHGLLRSRDVMAWDVQPVELFASLGDVVVDSDVRCGALAEARVGAGAGFGSMLYASVGTGISSTLVIDGTPWRGHRGEAIALGELPVERSIDTGTAANLEQFASGAAIARRYARLTGEAPEGGRGVLARADSGDRRAAGVVESAAVALGVALAWAVHLVDPALIVLGGGLGTSGGRWADVVRESYAARCRPSAPDVVAARLGSDSGVVGAGLIALSSLDA